MAASKVSIIIRTKNEEKYLEKVLKAVKSQTFKDYEIIIVDDNSVDKTLNIAKKYNCKIVTVLKGKFSHPYSCNLGAENSNGEFLVYLNGHSIPIGNKWLENGLKNFNDEKVAGVSSTTLAHTDGTIWDKLLYNIIGYTLTNIKFSNITAQRIFGTTNAIIRKDLWKKHNFVFINDGLGGEDWEWATYWINKGFKIVNDPSFRARHSHHLSFTQTLKQIINWLNMLPKSKTIPTIQPKGF